MLLMEYRKKNSSSTLIYLQLFRNLSLPVNWKPNSKCFQREKFINKMLLSYNKPKEPLGRLSACVPPVSIVTLGPQGGAGWCTGFSPHNVGRTQAGGPEDQSAPEPGRAQCRGGRRLGAASSPCSYGQFLK